MEISSANHIYENIYLGNLNAANDLQYLKEKGITHVLGLVDGQQKFDGIEYLIFPDVYDDCIQNIMMYFKDSFNFIEECSKSKGKILIHCFAGISRSSTIVIAYLIYKYKMNIYEAIKHTQKQRSIVHPNTGFLAQLHVFGCMTPDQMEIFLSSITFKINPESLM